MRESRQNLLWSLEEAGRQLGGVSNSTLYRMISDGQIEGVKVRKRLKVKAESVEAYINNPEHSPSASSKVEVKKCHIRKKAVPIGGFRSVQAAKELDALLGQ